MKTTKIFSLALVFLAVIALTSSCKKDNTQSTLQVRLTDAPALYDEVNIDIKEVKVKFSDDSTNDGWVSLSTNAKIYNLLGLQGGIDTLLATGTFPSNVVQQIRFILGTDNTIMDNGIVYPLTIPSGSESGLKIKVNKKLSAALETLLIDFDAALSINNEGPGDYKLRPVLKVK